MFAAYEARLFFKLHSQRRECLAILVLLFAGLSRCRPVEWIFSNNMKNLRLILSLTSSSTHLVSGIFRCLVDPRCKAMSMPGRKASTPSSGTLPRSEGRCRDSTMSFWCRWLSGIAIHSQESVRPTWLAISRRAFSGWSPTSRVSK